MSKQDGGNISPLHRQMVKGRNIVITEDPKLHLVWIYDRIFIKPLPHYLTSFQFWDQYLNDPSNQSKDDGFVKLRMAALGYLRTYYYLIQYESDFRIAQDPAHSLISKDVTWAQFCQFSAYFNSITDDEVSGRYRYGEIRLTRLNYYAPFLLGKSDYQRTDYQYRTYFARIQGPLLSMFAFLSILLNCMQVILAAASAGNNERHFMVFEGCYWVSLLVAVVTCFLLFMLVFLFFFKICREWRFAIHNRFVLKRHIQRQNSEGPHV